MWSGSCISRRSSGSLTQSSRCLDGAELLSIRRINFVLLSAGFPPSSFQLCLSLLLPPPPTPEIIMPFKTQFWPSSLGSASLHANSPAFWPVTPSQSSSHMEVKILPLESETHRISWSSVFTLFQDTCQEQDQQTPCPPGIIEKDRQWQKEQ